MTFAPLPVVPEGWAAIACDAPLHFRTWSAAGQGRAPSRHYRDDTPEALMTLPLQDVLADDAWLFLWWPDPHLPHMIEAMNALGFAYSGRAFTWIKTLSSLTQLRLISTGDLESILHLGLGKTTRKNSETAWLGRRGKPKILSHSVREAIVSARRQHSRKPDEFYQRIERFCPGPRLDLFGRQSREGWTIFGDQSALFDAPIMARRRSRQSE